MITVDEGSTNTIVFVNHGWGDVEDAKLEFTLADPKFAIRLTGPGSAARQLLGVEDRSDREIHPAASSPRYTRQTWPERSPMAPQSNARR